MTSTQKAASRAFPRECLEQIERIVFKYGDDMAVSIARSFERMEERVDSMEARLYARLSELSDQIAETAPVKH